MIRLLAFLILLTLPGFAHAQCTPPSVGLVGHWTLDETSGTTAVDSVGSNNGTYAGGADPTTDSVTGVIDTAIDFDGGTTGYVTLGASPSLDLTTTFTFSAWVKPQSAISGNTMIYSAGDTDQLYWNAAVWSDGTDVWFKYGEDNSEQVLDPANLLTIGEWHHVAFTKSGDTGTNVIVYVNGVEKSSGAMGTADAGGEKVIASRKEGNYDTQFDGQIDDVRIYDRVLSAAEISALYATRSTADAPAGYLTYDTRHARYMYCNGTDWVHAGIGSYNPNAVNFDGTNDWLSTTSFVGPANETKWTGSFWFKRNSTGGTDVVFDQSGGLDTSFDILGGGDIQIVAENSSSTIVVDFKTTTTFTDTTDWHHMMFSFDLTDTNKRHIYVDGVADALNVTTYNTAETMDFSASNAGVGNRETPVAGVYLDAAIADLWMDFGTYIDLSVEANRRKFISANGMPKYLGKDGSIPTGTAPDVFLSGDTANWHTNLGAGGGFTENGALTTASSQPGDITFVSGGIGAWSLVAGSELPIGNGLPSMTKLDNKTIALADDTNDELRTYTWNGATWALVGSGLSVVGTKHAVTALNSTTVALIEEDNDNLETYTWNGSAWSLVAGSALNITGVLDPGLATLDDSTIVFADEFNDQLRTYTWNGASWSLVVGSELAITGASNPSMAALDGNTIAYVDAGNDQLRTYTWNGATWALVTGSELAVAGAGSPALAALDDSTIAYIDRTNDELRTYSWNGATWTPVGTSLIVTGAGTPALAALNTDTVAYVDSLNDELRTYQFSLCLKEGQLQYNLDFNVMEYCNGVEWVAMGPVGGTPPTSGLLAHWKLDETSGPTITDSVGANNGTWTDNTGNDLSEESTAGILAGGIDFDGVDDQVNFGDVLDIGTGDLTVTGWVWVDVLSGDPVLIAKSEGWIGWMCHISSATAVFKCRLSDGPNAFDVTASTAANAVKENRWIHFAGVFDRASNLTLYIDGVERGSADISADVGNNINGTINLYMGRRNQGLADEWLDGTLDDVRVYNRALTAQEISQLYYFGLSGGLGDVNNACANPVGTEGEMIYNIDHSYLQYCNGEAWIGIGK